MFPGQVRGQQPSGAVADQQRFFPGRLEAEPGVGLPGAGQPILPARCVEGGPAPSVARHQGRVDEMAVFAQMEAKFADFMGACGKSVEQEDLAPYPCPRPEDEAAAAGQDPFLRGSGELQGQPPRMSGST